MSDSSEEKPLRTVSFVIHATRGVIRDQPTRRKTMFGLLLVAFLLLLSGSTFLQPVLNPRQHLVWSLLFWLACLWLTLTAMLLAVFDLMIVRREARRAREVLRRELAARPTASGSPTGSDGR